MFLTALCIITKNWKQLDGHQLVSEIRRSKPLTHAMASTNIKCILLHKRSQTERLHTSWLPVCDGSGKANLCNRKID